MNEERKLLLLNVATLFVLLFTAIVIFTQINTLKTRVERLESATRSTAPITVNIHVTTPKDAQKTLKALLPTLDEMRMIR